MRLSAYEKRQILAIAEWKQSSPSLFSKAFGYAASPVSRMVQRIVPDAAIRAALDFSSSAAEWLTDSGDIVRDAGVKRVEELKRHDLEKSDQLANEVHNWAIGMATVEGAGTGWAGVFGITVDVPAIIVIALRSIHKIGVCYGFEAKTDSDRDFVLAVLAASGANNMAEKVAALRTLRLLEVSAVQGSWKELADKAATEQLSRDVGVIGVKNLARQLGINLAKRKALQAIPAVGALVGASVNGWYVKEVGWAARRAFQERWLIENRKVLEIV